MSEQTQPLVSFEKTAEHLRGLAEYFANFASGIVDAFKTAGDKAPDILAAAKARYDVAIAAAIAKRELALAAGDVFEEIKWRQIADGMATSAFKLADETKSATDRLVALQVEINAGWRIAGKLAGPAFDLFAVQKAIREGDGNAAGEAGISILLATFGTAAAGGAAVFFGLSVPLIALFGGGGAVIGALSAKSVNDDYGRPFFDWLGTFCPMASGRP